MLGEKHDLPHEFPEYKDRIHELKLNDSNFAKKYDEYQELDNEVRRIEEGIETPSDEYTEELKLRRLNLKDELYAMLKGE